MATSFVNYLRALMTALDDGQVYYVSSAASPSNVSCTMLVNGTANASANRYDGAWVASFDRAVSGYQRRVRTAGYTPSTGTLNIHPDWSLPPQAGDQIWVTNLFPTIGNAQGFDQAVGEDLDYRTMVNRALSRLLVPFRFTIAITTSDTYTVGATAPYLDRPERLARDQQGRLMIYEPSPVSGRAPISSAWRGWELVLSGGSTALQVRTPFSSATGNLSVDVLRPANTLINGALSTTGLVNGADTAEASVNDVVTVALVEAYQALAVRAHGRPDGGAWLTLWKAQQTKAAGLAYYDRTQGEQTAETSPQMTPGVAA